MATACANVSLLSDRIDVCYGRRGRNRKFKMRLLRQFRIVVTHPKVLYDPNGERAARRDAKGQSLPPSSHAAERHGADRTMQDEQNRLNGRDPWSSQERNATHFLSDDALWNVRVFAAVQNESAMTKRAQEIEAALKAGTETKMDFTASVQCTHSIGEGMRRSKSGDWQVHSISSVTIHYEFRGGYWYEKTAFPNLRN